MKQLTFLQNFYKSFPISFGDSQEGQCDAFAIALKEFMQVEFPEIETTLMVIERTRINERKKKNNVLEFNPLSHVCLKVGDGFNYWDSQGFNALDAWCENWMQPDKSDYGFKVTDYFDEKPISEEELKELRLLQDQRSIDPKKIEQFKKNIEQEYKNFHIRNHIEKQINWAENYYQHGGCHEMAVAFHRTYGWKMMVMESKNDLHVVALSPDGLTWDSKGIYPIEEKKEQFRKETWSDKIKTTIIKDENELQKKYIEKDINDTKPFSLYSESEIKRATHFISDIYKEFLPIEEHNLKQKNTSLNLKPL